MNIAIIGYGKMGHKIEHVAIKQGHNIVLRIISANKNEMTAANLQKADVAIEFTTPSAAKANVLLCLEAGIPVISGTTGWDKELPEVMDKVRELNGTFLYASNFSIGVNLFFELNKFLADMMDQHPQYDVAIEETHHIMKKDAPSGTAIRLAEQICNHLKRKQSWTKSEETNAEMIHINSIREDDVPGTHKIKYSSDIDDIEIIHTAHNREGFASGAVMAVEFLAGKKGIFTMKDVLGLE